MRTVSKTVYTFDELSEESQERAHTDYLSTGDYFSWWLEWNDSLNAFCAIAPIEWQRFDVTAGHIDSRFTDSDIAELSGIRAWKWLQNNGWFDLAERNAKGECTLTGYCGDCPLFDPIAALFETPKNVPDLEQLFYECLQSWVFECRKDQEWHETLEHFAEMCYANQWEFDSYGELA